MAFTYIINNVMHLVFDDDAVGDLTGVKYDLGHHALEFIYAHLGEVREILFSYAKTLILGSENNVAQPEKFFKIMNYNVQLVHEFSPYLHFHINSFDNVVCKIRTNSSNTSIKKSILNNFTAEMGDVGKAGKNYFEFAAPHLELVNYYIYHDMVLLEDYFKLFYSCASLVSLNLYSKQETLKEEIKFIYSNIPFTEGLDHKQRLYFFDSLRDEQKYFNHTFETQTLALPRNIQKHDNKKLLKKAILEIKPDIEEMYTINNIDDLIIFEVIKMVTNKIEIKKCKYCDKFFIPTKNKSKEYCHRINRGETKPCNIIGSKRVYDKKNKKDPITKAYKTAYDRNRSRLRYNKISKDEFRIWGDKATLMRDKCKNGEISFGKFMEFLDSDRN